MRWDWQGSITNSSFRAAFEHLVHYSRQQHVKRWLADVSNLPLVGIDEQGWLSEHWLPRFATLHIREVALVLPVSLHNQLVVESILADGRRHSRADIQFFSDVPAALDWLTNANETLVEHLQQEWQRRLQTVQLNQADQPA
ncbi:STAS/SEC14 domain-containing protein [Hymenobacter metallilatus]|uniref:STAS/SEC14 domain-containing protein n=1 Tax=Hymenobacter metallilatus TaxID=2493666 RepID=A0A3R9P7P4_9BACT|nr:STAS/SEC14 domain-containing protein [Hymenobacter metallilatus]RSK30224.1 hypothetical protein EI290_15355 [Hymenobacter metallilatus]